jgi:hypothetical protein
LSEMLLVAEVTRVVPKQTFKSNDNKKSDERRFYLLLFLLLIDVVLFPPFFTFESFFDLSFHLLCVK